MIDLTFGRASDGSKSNINNNNNNNNNNCERSEPPCAVSAHAVVKIYHASIWFRGHHMQCTIITDSRQ